MQKHRTPTYSQCSHIERHEIISSKESDVHQLSSSIRSNGLRPKWGIKGTQWTFRIFSMSTAMALAKTQKTTGSTGAEYQSLRTHNPWAPCSLARTRRYGAPANVSWCLLMSLDVSWCLLMSLGGLLMPCHLRNSFEHLALEDRNSPFEFLSQRQRTRILPSCEVWRSPRGCDIAQRRAVPSGELTVCYWKWPFIVDFPINSMVIFHGKMLVHQRVITLCAKASHVQYMIWYVYLWLSMPNAQLGAIFSETHWCVCPLSTAFWATLAPIGSVRFFARHSRSAIREDGMVADGICTSSNDFAGINWWSKEKDDKGDKSMLYIQEQYQHISSYINHIQKIECFP